MRNWCCEHQHIKHDSTGGPSLVAAPGDREESGWLADGEPAVSGRDAATTSSKAIQHRFSGAA